MIPATNCVFSTALQQSEESDGAGVIIWAITATVVAAAALAAVAAIIGVLMCRWVVKKLKVASCCGCCGYYHRGVDVQVGSKETEGS